MHDGIGFVVNGLLRAARLLMMLAAPVFVCALASPVHANPPPGTYSVGCTYSVGSVGAKFAALIGLGALVTAPSIRATSAAGADWLTIAPSEAGFTSDLEPSLDKVTTEKRV